MDDIARLAEPGLGARVAGRLREIGYLHVTMDLAGYRRGSTNGVQSASAPAIVPLAPAVESSPIAFRATSPAAVARP